MGHVSSHFVGAAGFDGGDGTIDTRQRDGWSNPGDGGDRRPSFFYFYGFKFMFWERHSVEGVKGK